MHSSAVQVLLPRWLVPLGRASLGRILPVTVLGLDTVQQQAHLSPSEFKPRSDMSRMRAPGSQFFRFGNAVM